MAETIGNLLVGLGYDLSALEKGAPEAYRVINEQTLGMSAQMKRSSREGAEAFRTIDEMIGIHINRPMTRLLVETFPQFGKALADVLGGVAFGAVGFAGIELFERVYKGVESAKKATQEWGQAVRKSDETFADAMGGIEKQLSELRGQPAAIKFAIEGSEEARKQIDAVAQALNQEEKAAEKAKSLTNRIWSGVGDFASGLAGFAGALLPDQFGGDLLRGYLERQEQLSQARSMFATMQEQISDTLQIDKVKGTHDALALIATDLERVRGELQRMQQAGNNEGVDLAYNAQEFLEDARAIAQGSQQLAQARTAQQDTRDLQDELKDWNEQANRSMVSWSKLAPELGVSLSQAFKDAGVDAETLGHAMVKVNEEILRLSAARSKEFGLGTGVLPPSGAPALKDSTELMRIAGQLPGETSIEQQSASWQKAGEVLSQIETPAQRYTIALQALQELQSQGRITAEQFAAAEAQLGEKFTEAELHLQEMQKQLQRLLERSTSATAGVQAFFLELQVDAAQNGKFAFDFLTQGLHGFEDQLTKAIFEGKAKWKEFFRSMGEEAMKFALNKDLAGVFSMLSGSSIGKSLGLGTLIPHLGSGAGAAELQTAAVTLQSGSTVLLSAATALQAAAVEMTAGVGGGLPNYLNLPSSAFPSFPGFDSGTDSFSGGFAWVGEHGPELLNLPAGASVTPAGSAGRGDTHVLQDFRGAVVTSDLMTRADFARSMAKARPGIIGEAVANFSEIQKRTPSR